MEIEITPINGPKEMNYTELFSGNFIGMITRVNQLQNELSKLLPDATIRIKIKELHGNVVCYYNEDCRWVDHKFEPIRLQFLLHSKNTKN